MSKAITLIQRSPSLRLILLALPGLLVSFFLTSYFSGLYSGQVQFILLSLLFQVICGMGSFFFLHEMPKSSLRPNWTTLMIFLEAGALAIGALLLSLQFPSLFNQSLLLIGVRQLSIFFGLSVIALPFTALLNTLLENYGALRSIENTGFIQFICRNRAGFVLALFFFIAYFIFAQSLNFPGFYTRDQYFETDISDWIDRLTAPPLDKIYRVRAVHPAVILFLRPLTWLLSLPLNGNRLQAVFMLSALAGAVSVFMVWLIVKRRTGSTPFALISASLLGASAAHLLLSSMLETYIFSALALVTFCFLIQSDRIALKYTIPAGVVIFGITITNLTQACILYFLKLPRLKIMVMFVVGVLLTVLVLNVAQVQIFPFAKPIYEPSNLLVERKYGSGLFETRQWVGRVNLISRSILLYGIIAPTPYVLKEELGAAVPNFRTFKVEAEELKVAGYKGFSDIIAKIWIIIFGVAAFLFIFDVVNSPRQMGYPISLALCVGFSLILHILYGDDPMLYSPNWIYALVLFVSASFERWSDNKWIQLTFAVFLGMMIYTNLGLIEQIMSVSLPYYGR